VLMHAGAAMLLAWHYFRRYTVVRPPIGVLTLADVGIMIGCIIVVPYLYLCLPVWSITALLALVALALLSVTLEPILPRRATWVVALLLVVADVVTAYRGGPLSTSFLLVNNAVLVLMAVGITNLWAQSGMRVRDAAILGGALSIYDVLATTVAGQMAAVMHRLADLPFAPLVAFRFGAGLRVSLGLGDVLMATLFPLVMRKAFGRSMGLAAAALAVVAIGVVMLGLFVSGWQTTFPMMVVLGPLMLLQYGYWRRRLGPERTTWHYLRAEPLARPAREPGAG
jgi:hypothetical protein